MITDPTIIRIGEAVRLGHQGEREAARLLFAEIWDEIGGEQGDPLHECHRNLGDLDRAREHLRQAQATIGALGDDEYGQMIKQGMARIAEQLR